MSSTQKTVIGSTAILLMAFIAFGIYQSIRVIQTIPYSSNCATTLVKISQQNATIAPSFFGIFIISTVVFELCRRQMPKTWRFAYLITLGLGAGLIIIPWFVRMIYK